MLFLGKTYIHNAKDLSIAGIKKIQSGIERIKKKDKEETKSLENIEIKKTEEVKKNTKVEKQDANKNEVKPLENKVEETSKFPQELFKESIKNNNMEQIIEYVNQWKDADLEMNDKVTCSKRSRNY